jgi:hypothetical protein
MEDLHRRIAHLGPKSTVLGKAGSRGARRRDHAHLLLLDEADTAAVVLDMSRSDLVALALMRFQGSGTTIHRTA